MHPSDDHDVAMVFKEDIDVSWSLFFQGRAGKMTICIYNYQCFEVMRCFRIRGNFYIPESRAGWGSPLDMFTVPVARPFFQARTTRNGSARLCSAVDHWYMTWMVVLRLDSRSPVATQKRAD
jgi:hypothetical protein